MMNLIGEVLSGKWSQPPSNLSKVKPELMARYGFKTLSNQQVRRILLAEKELTNCAACTGKCSNMGYTQPVISQVDEWGAMRYQLCKWGQFKRLEKACQGGAVPMRYAEKTFADYEVTADNEKAVGYAKWYCQEQPRRGLYLYGATGTGKTFLSVLIAKALLVKFKSVIFGDVPSLLEAIKATFDGQGNRDEVMRRYTQCDLLILDDLGAGYVTEWNVGVLYQIVNERYNAMLPVIVTSNFMPQALEARLSTRDKFAAQRLCSRLSEMCLPLYLGEKDRRMAK